jgi:hypothetical protein
MELKNKLEKIVTIYYWLLIVVALSLIVLKDSITREPVFIQPPSRPWLTIIEPKPESKFVEV